MSVSLARQITELARVPRAVYLRFPFGRTFGPAGNRELQRQILQDALRALVDAQAPGTIVDLPYRWPSA